jgi:site-specific DNA recombinase
MKIKKALASKRAAIYLRMSSNPQKDSIPQQREACLLYASDNGFEIVGEYADEGISGISSKLKRAGFQRLVTDAQAGKFEYVICWEQNRASRSKPREFFAEMNPLVDAGVKLVFTDKGIVDLDKFSDFLTTAVGANSGNDYVLSMARSVVRGQHEKKAARGKWVSGTPPLGLDYVKGGDDAGQIILGDPVDVETVRLMFRWYCEGFSDRGIVIKLRDERGIVRTQRFVQSALTNPLYAGDYRWNANSRARFFGLRNGRITNEFTTGKTGVDDVIYIESNHPAIIDRETFSRVQIMRAERSKKTTPFRNGGEHLLTGLCRCSKCGHKFTGNRYKKGDRLTLTCNGYRLGVCKGNHVNQRDVVASIVASFDEILSETHVAKIREAYAESLVDAHNADDVEALSRELDKLQKQYAETRAKLAKLPEDLIADFADDLRSQKAEIKALESRIEAASAPVGDELDKLTEQVESLGDVVSELKRAVLEIADTEPQLVRQLIASIVETVVLDVDCRVVSDRFHRFTLTGGEIQLKPGFNLIPAS